MPEPFQVFISHFAGERKIAEEIQNFLSDSFPALKVFRSSDTHSIPTAAGQYSAILSALEASAMMIVLLSSESSRRPWMPFETGFAMGRNITVFTLMVRGATPTDLPSPFTAMQLRSINETEVEKILSAVETFTRLPRESASIKALLRGIREAESLLPNVALTLQPYMFTQVKGCLCFRLTYEGTEQVNLRTVTAGIPIATKDPNWSPHEVHGHLDTERRKIDDVEYLFLRYWAGSPPPSMFPVGGHLKVITPELYPPKDSKDLYELRFALNPNIDVFQDHFLIRCWAETAKNRTAEQLIPMSRIER